VRAKKAPGTSRPGTALGTGKGRVATRGGGEVIELEYGITVYPARAEGGRWRAVWHEDGQRQQCEAPTEEKLAGKLEKVSERLAADAPNVTRTGADLIAWYLNPDRLPAERRWSRKHADTQRRLCERLLAAYLSAHRTMINGSAPCAARLSRSVLARLALLAAEARLSLNIRVVFVACWLAGLGKQLW
jgi:hypothetical protein